MKIYFIRRRTPRNAEKQSVAGRRGRRPLRSLRYPRMGIFVAVPRAPPKTGCAAGRRGRRPLQGIVFRTRTQFGQWQKKRQKTTRIALNRGGETGTS